MSGTTMTGKVQLTGLPPSSTVLALTSVVPTGKSLPEGWL